MFSLKMCTLQEGKIIDLVTAGDSCCLSVDLEQLLQIPKPTHDVG